MRWTAEHIAALREFHAEGLSASQAAVRFNQKFRATITRNSVVSELHHLGIKTDPEKQALNCKRNRPPNTQAQRPNYAPKTKSPAKPADFAVTPSGQIFERAPVVLTQPTPLNARAWKPLPGSTPVTLAELERGFCKWPLDLPDATEFHFCALAADGGPYCAKHAEMSAPRAGTKERHDERNGLSQRKAA